MCSRLTKGDSWWPLVLAGIAGFTFGLVTFARSTDAAQVPVYILGVWDVSTGLLHIVSAIELRQIIEGEWSVAAVGVISILFGGLVKA